MRSRRDCWVGKLRTRFEKRSRHENGLRHYAIDIAIVAVAVALLAFAAFGNHGNVTERAPEFPEAGATPPPLSAIAKMTTLSANTPYSLDVVQPDGSAAVVVASKPAIEIPKHTQTTFSGWAVDGPSQRAANSVYVLLDGKVATSCRIGTARYDVAQAYRVPAYASSGFACTIPADRIVAGRHTMELDIVTQGSRSFYRVKLTNALVVR